MFAWIHIQTHRTGNSATTTKIPLNGRKNWIDTFSQDTNVASLFKKSSEKCKTKTAIIVTSHLLKWLSSKDRDNGVKIVKGTLYTVYRNALNCVAYDNVSSFKLKIQHLSNAELYLKEITEYQKRYIMLLHHYSQWPSLTIDMSMDNYLIHNEILNVRKRNLPLYERTLKKSC